MTASARHALRPRRPGRPAPPASSAPERPCRSATSGTCRPTSGSSTRPTCSTPSHYAEWLDLLTDDIHYVMPVRVTTALGAGFDTSPGHGALRRGQVLAVAAGSPGSSPSMPGPKTRRPGCVTTSPTSAHSPPRTPTTSSSTPAVLLFRSRGDVREAALISAGREDLLRRTRRRLAAGPPRTILVDDSVHAHAEPGDLPVSGASGPPDPGPGQAAGLTGTPHGGRSRWRNEFAEVRISRVRHPQRLTAADRVAQVRPVGRPVPAGARGADLAGHRRRSRP